MYRKYFKRFLDILLSLTAIVILSPLLMLLSLLIYASMGSPVFFTQERPGLNERIFRLFKFRTMNNKKDNKNELLPDDQRITGIGRFLRRTSLDELPELFNILRGDMSFVGPRPLLVRYLPYYSEEEKRRHSVRPGLTGLAQINGRNAITWEEKFSFDIRYVENINFSFDVKILFKTFLKVMKREGIDFDPLQTTTAFDDYMKEKNKNL